MQCRYDFPTAESRPLPAYREPADCFCISRLCRITAFINRYSNEQETKHWHAKPDNVAQLCVRACVCVNTLIRNGCHRSVGLCYSWRTFRKGMFLLALNNTIKVDSPVPDGSYQTLFCTERGNPLSCSIRSDRLVCECIKIIAPLRTVSHPSDVFLLSGLRRLVLTCHIKASYKAFKGLNMARSDS